MATALKNFLFPKPFRPPLDLNVQSDVIKVSVSIRNVMIARAQTDAIPGRCEWLLSKWADEVQASGNVKMANV
jgi:hypothetical protein